MSLIPGSSGCPVAQKGTSGLWQQLSHCMNITWDSPQGTGRLSKPTSGRAQPTCGLQPSSLNTSTSARTHTLPEQSFGGSRCPSAAQPGTAQQAPNSHQTASRQQPAAPCICVQRGEDSPKNLVPAPPQVPSGRSLLRPALTFLTPSGSALPGALPSKKLRLLATPSEDGKRLF